MLRKNKTSPGGDGKGSGPGSRQRLSKTGVIKVFRVQDVSSTFVNPAETDTKYMCQICRLPRDSSRSSISSDLYKGGELSFDFEWPKKSTNRAFPSRGNLDYVNKVVFVESTVFSNEAEVSLIVLSQD